MNLMQQLDKANEDAIQAHKQAMKKLLELITVLVETGSIMQACELRVQLDYHQSVVDTIERSEYD